MPTSTPELTPKKKTPPPAGSKRLVTLDAPGHLRPGGGGGPGGARGAARVHEQLPRQRALGRGRGTVLVANRAIDKGTSGDVIAEARLFNSTKVSEVDASEGAFADPSALRGQVATEAIYEGEQLTVCQLRLRRRPDRRAARGHPARARDPGGRGRRERRPARRRLAHRRPGRLQRGAVGRSHAAGHGRARA